MLVLEALNKLLNTEKKGTKIGIIISLVTPMKGSDETLSMIKFEYSVGRRETLGIFSDGILYLHPRTKVHHVIPLANISGIQASLLEKSPSSTQEIKARPSFSTANLYVVEKT